MRARARSRVRVLAPVLALIATVAGAQPRNDACVDRTYVTFLPYSDRESIAAATLDDGEAAAACASAPSTNSVWYAMPPPIDGLYLFSTCGSDFDTALQLYDGAFCDSLHVHADGCNDDSELCGPGSKQSAVVLRLPRGPASIVHAQVTSVGEPTGQLRFSMQLVPRARNDLCEAARVLRGGVVSELLDVADTGADAADPDLLPFCGAVGTVQLGSTPHSVWYRYTATQTGPIAIDPTGTTTPVALAVYEDTGGGCAALGARVACGANTPISFGADAGKTYRFYVAVPARVQPDVLRLRVMGPDNPPVASAVAPPTTGPGATVALDGSASRDVDGDALTYRWTQDTGPPVSLQNANLAVATFVVPEVAGDATLGFTLAVSDGVAISTASVTIAVTPAEADRDGDGVPASRDACPETAPGRAVDATGCACDDAGHVACPAGSAPCTVGRCDPTTAACVQARAPAGTACPGDGDPCTRDLCDAGGQCTHARLESYAAAACAVDGLASRLDADQLADGAPRLVSLVARTRYGIATAEASALVGDRRRASRRLRLAAHALARFAKTVARLETRQRIPAPSAGRLLDGALSAAQRIAELGRALTAARPPRASR